MRNKTGVKHNIVSAAVLLYALTIRRFVHISVAERYGPLPSWALTDRVFKKIDPDWNRP